MSQGVSTCAGSPWTITGEGNSAGGRSSGRRALWEKRCEESAGREALVEKSCEESAGREALVEKCWWQVKKSSIIKVLIILFGHLWEVELTYRYIFVFKFT
jgi:hypothetical protein